MNRVNHVLGELDHKKHSLLQCVGCLPKKILGMHGRENMVEFVLHDVSNGFNLKRAAYLVDNPDFNILKGVAGFDHTQSYKADGDIWQDTEQFTNHMQQAAYNQQVRCLVAESFIKKGKSDKETVETIAGLLGFQSPLFYAWPVKHDNHGILVYEKCDPTPCDCNYLLDGLCLIGMCPIF